MFYSIVYCHIVYYENRVYDYDGGYEGEVWLQGLLDDLKISHDLLKINYDSMIAIYLAKK